MRIGIKQGFLVTLFALSMGLISCDEQKERVFDNPNDVTGTSWTPPTVEVLTRSVVVGMGDTTFLRAVVSDPDPQDRVVMMRAIVAGQFDDSAWITTDTVERKVVFAEPGRIYKVHVWVHDNKGVWSVRPDSAFVDVHRYAPVASMKAMSDSVEPGDSVRYAIPWTDTAGKVVKYLWSHGGKIDTTLDSIRGFVAGGVGQDVVVGYAIDDDGNASQQVTASTVVRTLNPWVVSLKANKDTAEAYKDIILTMRGADHSPGRIAKYVWIHDGRTDTTTDSTRTLKVGSTGVYEVAGLVLDEDGYPSPAKALSIPVVTYPPKALLFKAVSDTAEKGKGIKFNIRGSDRSPGRIVKWMITHEGRVDTIVSPNATRSMLDTFTTISFANIGMGVASAYAVDEDGLVSGYLIDTIAVVNYIPTTISVRSQSDTVEAGKPFKVVVRGSDRAPGKIVKWIVFHENKTDSSTKDSIVEIVAMKANGTQYIAGYVTDNDGNTADWMLDTVEVRIFGPAATSVKVATDTVEQNKPVKCALKGSDRSPGRIVKWRLSYAGKTDSIVLNSATKSLVDTFLNITPASLGGWTVTAVAIDEDGNSSIGIMDTFFVTTYPPTATSLQAASDTVEAGKPLKFKLSGSDRSPGTIKKWIFYHDGQFDTASADTMSLIPSQIGKYIVGGMVLDNDGNSSAIVRDTVQVAKYVPSVVSLKPASDTGEAGKAIKYTLKAADRSPGKIAKWVFSHDGRNDTIKADLTKSVSDTSISLTPPTSGSYSVSGFVIDNDGNVSAVATSTIVVTSYIPGIVSLTTSPDTAEVGKSLKIILKAIDRSPGKIAKWVFAYPGKTDTVKADLTKSVNDTSITVKAGVAGVFAITATVVDNDGNVSAPRSLSVPVVFLRPTAILKGPDSGEINRPVKLTITAKDRNPGTISGYVWTYAGKTDTTTDSSRSFTQALAGAMTVSGWAIDNDSNLSDRTEFTLEVKAHAPILQAYPSGTRMVALGDSARFGGMATDAPTDPDGDSLLFKWKTDDGRSGSFLSGDSAAITDSVTKTVKVDVTAYDKDSLASFTQNFFVQFLPTQAAIHWPSPLELLSDTVLSAAWTGGLYTDSFRILLDTLPILSANQNVLRREKTTSENITMGVPLWNKSWHVRILSFGMGDSALSDDIPFATPEDIAKRSTLANLELGQDYNFNTPIALDSVFRSNDTVYSAVLPEGIQTIYVRGTGTVSTGSTKQVIEIAGLQGSGELRTNLSVLTVPATVAVKVYSIDGNIQRVYRVHLTRVTSPYVKLEALSLGTGYSLSPSFHPDSTNYTVSIPAGESTPITWTGNSIATIVVKHNNGTNYWDTEAVVRGSTEDTAGVLLTVSRTGSSDNFYRIKVKMLPSRETRLSSLSEQHYPFESFSVDSSLIQRNFAEGTTSVSILPYLREGQTMLINGIAAMTGVANALPLTPGMNTHTIKVTAADGASTRTYTLLFYRQPSTNNYLGSLDLLHGSINFYYEYQNYQVVLPYEQDHIAVRASPTMTNNGGMRLIRIGKTTTDTVALSSGVWSDSSYLPVNDSVTYRVQVKAEDTAIKRIYDVLFVRAMPDTMRQLSSLSLSSTQSLLSVPDGFNDYLDTVLQANVPFSDSLFLVSASWYESWKIRSVMVSSDTLTNDIYTRDTIVLRENDTTEIDVLVTAQDSTKSRTYKIKVFRSAPSSNALLSYLYVNSKRGNLWQGLTDSFDLSVPYEDSLVTFQPHSSDAYVRRITVDDSVTATQTWSDSVVLTKVADTNRVLIVVTAQDTTVKRTYVVRIFRQAAHTDASLSNLVLTSMTGGLALSPSFSGNDTVYTASTLFLDSMVTVKPTWTDPVATSITVNGTALASGATSSQVHLPVGDSTEITVVVTAQDRSVTRTYMVKVYRNLRSTNALLAGFGENVGTLSPMVNGTDTVYTLNVVSTVSSVTLAPTVSESHASFTVNGNAATRVVSLGAAGTTTNVTVVVTAQNLSTTRTYTLNINRERDASLIGGQINSDQTLTLAGSPYVVEAALVVNKDVTLTIDSGVRLKFNEGIGMTVKGTLIARGTPSQKIVFTQAGASKWGILYFDTMAVSAAYDGSGNYVSGSILKNCVIEYSGNSGIANAAAVYLKQRFPHMDSTTVQYSAAQGIFGTGLGDVTWSGLQVKNSAGNGINLNAHKFRLRQSSINDNGRGMHVTATSSYAFQEDWLVVDTCQFLRNSVSGAGAGVYVYHSESQTNLKTTFRGNLFESNNAANSRGGAVYIDQSYYNSNRLYLFENNEIRNNQARDGGAIFIRRYYDNTSTYRLVGNLIEGNTATNVGGVSVQNEYSNGSDVYHDSANTYRNNRSLGTDGYSGALYISNTFGTVRIVGSRFEGNSAPNSGTGAIELGSVAGTAEVVNCKLVRNTGAREGAIRTTTPTTLSSNLFQGNTTPGTRGAVYWGANVTGTITNNTFSGNTAAMGGATISTVMQIDGFPMLSGNNFLTNSTDRVLRTDNVFGETDIDAKGNWWGSVSPMFYTILVDGGANLPQASSLGFFDISTNLSAPNSSAPATE